MIEYPQYVVENNCVLQVWRPGDRPMVVASHNELGDADRQAPFVAELLNGAVRMGRFQQRAEIRSSLGIIGTEALYVAR